MPLSWKRSPSRTIRWEMNMNKKVKSISKNLNNYKKRRNKNELVKFISSLFSQKVEQKNK